MLLQRIITGIILASLSLAAIFYLNEIQFAVFIGIFTTLAAWEWSRLAGWEKFWQQILYASFVAVIMIILVIGIYYQNNDTKQLLEYLFLAFMIIVAINPLLWLYALILIVAYQYDRNYLPKSRDLLGVFMLLPAWFSLCAMKAMGFRILLFFIMLIWVADIGAFFVGRTFGKHKLASKVSPGKSIEGVLGALIFGILFSFIFISKFYKNYSYEFETIAIVFFILLSIITVIFSIVGDLFESLFKRQMGMKDSSQLLPGHGGFLDRLDSVIAAAPVFLMGFVIWGIVFD